MLVGEPGSRGAWGDADPKASGPIGIEKTEPHPLPPGWGVRFGSAWPTASRAGIHETFMRASLFVHARLSLSQVAPAEPAARAGSNARRPFAEAMASSTGTRPARVSGCDGRLLHDHARRRIWGRERRVSSGGGDRARAPSTRARVRERRGTRWVRCQDRWFEAFFAAPSTCAPPSPERGRARG
jgi:hypothetical protein